MDLSIKDNYFIAQFNWIDRFSYGVFRRELRIPLENIVDANNQKLSAPPIGLIAQAGINFRAGSFLGFHRKEFWYKKWGQEYLVLELRNNKYNRVVLGVKDSASWIDDIKREIEKRRPLRLYL